MAPKHAGAEESDMLVLARKTGQSIVVGDNIIITVIEIRGDQVRLGILAPRSIPVHRKELLDQVKAQNIEAAAAGEESRKSLSDSRNKPADAELAPQDSASNKSEAKPSG